MVICAVGALMCRSMAIWGSEGAIMLADIMGMSCPREKSVLMRSLREVGKRCGFRDGFRDGGWWGG